MESEREERQFKKTESDHYNSQDGSKKKCPQILNLFNLAMQ